jgi:hypothetical protein
MLRPFESGRLGTSQIAEIGKAKVGPRDSVKKAVPHNLDEGVLRPTAIESERHRSRLGPLRCGMG